MSLSKNVVKFNTQTSARDKIFRFLQYSSRLLLWQLTYGSPNIQGEVITRLMKFEAALGLSRKLFRLGNCVDLAYKTVDALAVQNPGIRALMVTSHAMKSIWLLIDHFLWFGKVGVLKLDLPYWTRWSLRAWLVCLVAASIADMILIMDVQNKVQRFRKGSKDKTKIPSQLQVQWHNARLNFWRDFCDMFIPMGGLGYASPGFAAMCGVVSSVIGFIQEWEKHIQPFQPLLV